MLGKLKAMAASGATDKIVEKVAPQLSEHLEKLKSLSPESIHDDEKYTNAFITPTLTAITASTSGVTKLIPGFNDKFTKVLMNLRNEIITIDGDSVKLVDNYQSKLGPAIVSGIKS